MPMKFDMISKKNDRLSWFLKFLKLNELNRFLCEKNCMNHICKGVFLAILSHDQGWNCRASDQEIFHHKRLPGRIDIWHSKNVGICHRTQQENKSNVPFFLHLLCFQKNISTKYLQHRYLVPISIVSILKIICIKGSPQQSDSVPQPSQCDEGRSRVHVRWISWPKTLVSNHELLFFSTCNVCYVFRIHIVIL